MYLHLFLKSSHRVAFRMLLDKLKLLEGIPKLLEWMESCHVENKRRAIHFLTLQYDE